MRGLIGAIVGGVIGAIIWAAIAYFMEVQIGWVAWGVGALVGFLSAAAGGEGTANAGMCALVAFLSLMGGKALSVKLVLAKDLGNVLRPEFARLQADAKAFESVSIEDRTAFMVERGYTEAESPEDVLPGELTTFKTEVIPLLEDLNAGLTLKQYRKQLENSPEGKLLAKEMFRGTFGILSIVFFLLGVGTAFKLGMGLAHETM